MQEVTEKIGKVELNLTWYPGEDLYSDGEIEDRMLQIAQETSEAEMNQVIAREKDWAILYHMSHIRENILEAVPFDGNEDVLEIGSGCGAVTGSLARRCRSVTCVDLSRKRSQINAWRHRDMDNISVLVGNFRDIEANLDRKFDCVTLIGVFEYALGYIGTEDPYGEFLRLIRAHLKENGRLILAIENRLGLKYWAGCREDHTGHLFEGLTDYPQQDYVHTFSKPELIRLFEKNGFADYRFCYPYPDYKLPTSVFSDEYLPTKGELNTNIWNFDRDRLVLFDESKVFDSLLQSDLFDQFSNSYLVIGKIAGKKDLPQEDHVIYSRFSNDRSRELAIRTDIWQMVSGDRKVVKSACFPEGEEHIARMARSYPELAAQFEGTELTVNRCTLEDGRLVLEYKDGAVTLEEKLRQLWRKGKKEDVIQELKSFCALIESKADRSFFLTPEYTALFGEKGEEYLHPEDPDSDKNSGCEKDPGSDRILSLPLTDLDMVAGNILLSRDRAGREERTLTDYEWTCDFPVPVRFVTFRIWHYFFAGTVEDREEDDFLREAGYTPREQKYFRAMEQAWQQNVQNDHIPLRTLYAQITPGTTSLNELMAPGSTGTARHYRSVIFYGEDGLFRTNQFFGQSLYVQKDGHFEITISLSEIGYTKYLRWDPIENQMCRIRIDRIIAPAMVELVPRNGFTAEDGWDEFWTLDPGYLVQGDFHHIDCVTIEGQLQLLGNADMLPVADTARIQRDEYAAKIQELETKIDVMSGTKIWRAADQLRAFRNFCMARIRGMYIFRDKHPVDNRYQLWFQEHSATEHQLRIQRKLTLPREPLISILVPTWNTPAAYLREMIDSVIGQTYGKWELCIADSSVSEQGRNQELAGILEEYHSRDPRVKYVLLKKNLGISGNTNAAAGLAGGDYIALLDHDDILAPDALFEAAAAISTLQPDVIYTDEDKVDMEGKNHFDPNLKPDFAPDLLRSHNYITHFLLVKAQLFRQVGELHGEYDGAQDYDLILRCTENTRKICHIPKILYYWRVHPGSTSQNPEGKLYAYEAGNRAIADHLKRCGLSGQVQMLEDKWGLNHVRYDTPGDPLVSVVIPNKDHVKDLDLCIRSVMTRSSYRNIEIVVVENNSTEAETESYYQTITEEFPQVRIVRWEKEFNYSAINNFGVQQAKGDYLLLLNNDTELLEPDSIGEMLGICMRIDVGCVGAKLLFADDTVQHAGIILGPGGFAGHVFSGIKKDDNGFMMRAQMTGDWSAVTAACMMVSRKSYELVNGFSEEFAVALNDVDFCMKLRREGLLVVMTPFALWHHYESKSRGYEDTPEKKARFEKEVARFRKYWGDVVDAGDPYYNTNLSVDRLPFSLW